MLWKKNYQNLDMALQLLKYASLWRFEIIKYWIAFLGLLFADLLHVSECLVEEEDGVVDEEVDEPEEERRVLVLDVLLRVRSLSWFVGWRSVLFANDVMQETSKDCYVTVGHPVGVDLCAEKSMMITW